LEDSATVNTAVAHEPDQSHHVPMQYIQVPHKCYA